MKTRTLTIAISLTILSILSNKLIARDAPTTTATSATPCNGNNFSIPISITNFTQVTAISLRLDYNPTMLNYTGYSNTNTSLPGGLMVNRIIVNSTLHKIMITWSNVEPVTLNNEAKLLDIVFTYIGGSPTLTFNNTSSGSADCEYADENGDQMNDSPTANFYHNATVTFSPLGSIGTISGITEVLPGQSSETYTVPPVTNATSYIWTLPEGAAGFSTTNTITVTYSDYAVSGNITVKGHNACGDTPPSDLLITVNRLIHLKLYLEGLYNTETQLLNKASDEYGEYFGADTADVIDIEIRNSTAPYSVIFTATSLNLNTNGTCQFEGPDGLANAYYLSLKHRNHIGIWSSTPVSFAGANPEYDFTLADTQAYGQNMKQLAPGVWGLWAGDVFGDGSIDDLDMEAISQAANGFEKGYTTNDLNGDGVVDALDLILIDNNMEYMIWVITP